MLGPVIAAAVVELGIAVHEDLFGAVRIALGTAMVGPLVFFRKVIQRAFQSIQQPIIQMQSSAG